MDRQRVAARPDEDAGQKQVDATDLAYQFGFFAQNNKWGPIVANGDQMVPDAAIGMFAVRKDFLEKNRDVVIRFAMAYLQAAKEFNAAAQAPDKHHGHRRNPGPDHGAEQTRAGQGRSRRTGATSTRTACRRSNSIMEMQDFWSGKYFHFVEKKVTREQLFDLNVAKEAQARLAKDKPFGP